MSIFARINHLDLKQENATQSIFSCNCLPLCPLFSFWGDGSKPSNSPVLFNIPSFSLLKIYLAYVMQDSFVSYTDFMLST